MALEAELASGAGGWRGGGLGGVAFWREREGFRPSDFVRSRFVVVWPSRRLHLPACHRETKEGAFPREQSGHLRMPARPRHTLSPELFTALFDETGRREPCHPHLSGHRAALIPGHRDPRLICRRMIPAARSGAGLGSGEHWSRVLAKREPPPSEPVGFGCGLVAEANGCRTLRYMTPSRGASVCGLDPRVGSRILSGTR